MTGRELDAMVAEKVMGICLFNGNPMLSSLCLRCGYGFGCHPEAGDLFSPTTYIRDAMRVAENICARPDRLGRNVELWTRSRKDWAYAAFKANPLGYGGYEFIGEGEDDGGNLCVAICLAALKALGLEVKAGGRGE